MYMVRACTTSRISMPRFKSSLAFDTIFAEGQRRYVERPDVDKITGLSPVISIEQKTTNKNPRSTVGTTTEVYDYLRLLYARAGEAYSYLSGEKMAKYTEEQILDLILKDYKGKRIYILAPAVHLAYVWTVRYAKSCPA